MPAKNFKNQPLLVRQTKMHTADYIRVFCKIILLHSGALNCEAVLQQHILRYFLTIIVINSDKDMPDRCFRHRLQLRFCIVICVNFHLYSNYGKG